MANIFRHVIQFTNKSTYFPKNIKFSNVVFFSLGEPLQSGKFDSFRDADLRCPVCGKLFHNRSNMKRHMCDVHSDIKRFRCTFCNQAFKRKSALRQHLNSVHWQADK